MKKIILTALTALLFVNVMAQSSTLQWAKQTGSAGDDGGLSIATDTNGNVYTIGAFTDTIDIDPGPAVQNLYSAGDIDIYIQKLDGNGNFIWAKQFGGPGFDRGISITTDLNGDIIATGDFEDTIDFDPGPNTLNFTAQDADIFILKLNPNGNLIWAKQIGGPDSEVGHSTTTDINGNIYVTGDFWGVVDFDPSSAVFNMTAVDLYDYFVIKLDDNGNFIWAKQVGSVMNDVGYSVITDGNGNVYTSGSFELTADFDPGAGVNNLTSAGRSDIFIQKFDTNGNFVWAKRMGGPGYDEARSISLDANNNIYVTGYFEDVADFSGGGTPLNLTSNGNYDAYVQKIDANGNVIWAKQLGGTQDVLSFAISAESTGNIYVTGTFAGSADFDPNAITFNLTSNGSDDIFMTRLDANGNFVWAESYGSTGVEFCTSITHDGNGNIYTTGGFSNTVDFDPSTSVNNLIALGNTDNFVIKLANGPLSIKDKHIALPPFSLFPNPSNGDFTITFETTLPEVDVIIMDITGRKIMTNSKRNISNMKLFFDAPIGTYLIQIKTPEGQQIVKFIRE